jgi:hypothetical protein
MQPFYVFNCVKSLCLVIMAPSMAPRRHQARCFMWSYSRTIVYDEGRKEKRNARLPGRFDV